MDMDNIDNYIWRRRIHHGVRYQKVALPFPDSVEIGLEFNAALEREDKLDLSLLTNGVMLELCDFAKTVTKSEKYFIFEMLEFNFELGVDVDNDQQCYVYATRTHNKIKQIKEQVKLKPHRWKEAFPLPDVSVMMVEQHERYYPKRNTTVDSSVLSDDSRRSRAESNTMDFFIKKRGRARLKLTAETFPFCTDLGVTLVVRPEDAPKQKLNTNLLTNGVMIELLEFSRVLCGTRTGIVHDLVKQNFGEEVEKTLLRFQITRLIERKCTCLTSEDKEAFRKEVYKVHRREPRPKKRKLPDDEGVKEPTETLVLQDTEEKDFSQDSDLSYMCPVDFETEMSDSEAGPEQVQVDSLSLVDVKEEEEEMMVCQVQPQINERSLKSVHLKDLSYLFYEDKNKVVDVKSHNEKLWRRRSTRSKQILQSSRVNDMFARCRERGLDFNVASGSRWNMDLLLLTNAVLWEVYKFAYSMTKSLRSFFLEIMNNNFVLVLRDELHERNFIFYTITKERMLQSHPDREKEEFLNSPFHFPDIYMVRATGGVKVEQDVDPVQEMDGDQSQQTDMDFHPFCKKLSLNLWSAEERPLSQKLHLSSLTNGAVFEVFDFIRELCGSVREMVNDILEHNFDLDLQSGETEASQVIQRWYGTQKSMMKRQAPSPKINRWLSMVVPLSGQAQLSPQTPTSVLEEEEEEDDDDMVLEDIPPLNGDEDVKEEEDQEEEVNSYHRCEGIGLELDINVEREAKTKLDLNVLTRGVLFEMHQYVVQNCNRYVPALYEILDYNFDLSSQSHRKVEFAWSVASKVISIARKTGRKGEYLNRVFQLPIQDSEVQVCKEEPEDGELDQKEDNEVQFVQELRPVDIEVEID